MRPPRICAIPLAVLPNWFVAFPVYADWIERLPALPPRFRRFAPGDVHATLMFLGSCGETAARAAFDATQESLRKRAVTPISITWGKVVPMGPQREYTALSALLDQGRDVVTELMREHRDVAADAAGVRRDRRSPIPHVTLGRPQRRATEEDRAAGLEWASRVELPSTPHYLERCALYTWHNERNHGLFRIVEEFSFAV
jgi:RNA 2',3'-cyclic 3'-phosphodiesterase